mgnify:CR=1 FL=1
MDVTASNFNSLLPAITDALSTASFVSVDLEMSGITPPKGTPRTHLEDTPQERYEKLKDIPETYAILQLGLTLFHEVRSDDSDSDSSEDEHNSSYDSQPRFKASAYNVYCFPKSGGDSDLLTLSVGSVKFLEQNHMDWNKWIGEGVGYADEEGEKRMRVYFDKVVAKIDESVMLSNKSSSDRSTRLTATRSSDILFVTRQMQSIRAFIDQSNSSNTLLLEPCNSFLRRILYGEIEDNFPGLTTESAGGRIQILRMNASEKRQLAEKRKKDAEADLLSKIGVRSLFLAISQECCSRGMPVVVHNGQQDLMFMMTHFQQNKLPNDWGEMKGLINDTFPCVVDTKYLQNLLMSTRHANGLDNAFSANPNNLKDLFAFLEPEGGFRIRFCEGHDKYSGDSVSSSFEHEAAFDAYLTGCCFIELQRQLHALSADDSPPIFGTNRLFTYNLLYTTNLQTSDDPFTGCDRSMMVHSSPQTTIRIQIKNGNRTTDDRGKMIVLRTSDIINNDVSTNYAVRWTSSDPNQTQRNDVFIVSFELHSEAEQFQKSSKMGNKYSHLFQCVETYEDFFTRLEAQKRVAEKGEGITTGVFDWFSKVFGGAGKKRTNEDNKSNTSNKRKRVV